MKIVYFTHSLASCWNHGNAHFLRGVLSELIARGHDVQVWEPDGAWSLANLLADHGEAGLAPIGRPILNSTLPPTRRSASSDRMVESADLVIVHEWNEPGIWCRGWGRSVCSTAGSRCCSTTPITARSAIPTRSAPSISTAMTACWPSARRWRRSIALGLGRPGVRLARGGRRHLFHPPASRSARKGLVWIGNWGDGERTAESRPSCSAPRATGPCRSTSTACAIPPEAKAMLARYGARYHGWAPTPASRGLRAPSRHGARAAPLLCRRPARHPDDPVFEALACGIPLVSAPWRDTEGLFRPGQDYLVARDGEEMTRHLRALRDDPDLRAEPRPLGPGDHPRPPHLRPPRRRAARHRGPARPRSWRTPHEDRLLRIQPAVLLLERRGHLLSRHARELAGAATTSRLLRARRLRSPAAPRHRSARLGQGGGL
jgi:hypothetical protein